MDKPLRVPPAYAIRSVDHALRLATALQVEGGLTVTDAAERLGVARSTAHRLLQMLVFRDFAAQDEQRIYRPGAVLSLVDAHESRIALVRTTALPHLRRLVSIVNETANLGVLVGATTRFVASVECEQALRVTSREGMAFPADRTTSGMLLLADMPTNEAVALCGESTDLSRLRLDISRIRRQGFFVNQERSERGVVAVGVPVRDTDGRAIAGLAVSMPSVRYDKNLLSSLVTMLADVAQGMERDL